MAKLKATKPMMPTPTNGAEATPKRLLGVEVGSSGLNRVGGYIAADFLQKLQGLNGYKVYKEMSLNDPIISASLFAIKMLIRGVKWHVEAADDTDAATASQELVEAELFDLMETPFAGVISEICTMFPYGYAPMEIVWTRRPEGNSIGIRKLVLRSQETVERWQFDQEENELIGMWQLDYFTGKHVFIPITKLLLFRTETALQNPEGQSVLRGSYVSWVRKRSIEEAEGRAAMRAAGVVMVKIPGQFLMPGLGGDELAVAAAYKDAASKLAQDRQGSIVLPSDVDPETKAPLYSLEYVVADGRRSGDMTPIIERIDKRIASTVLADFILLGQQAVGSFALSSDKTSLFADAIGAWLQVIAEVFNRDLLPRMWELNGFDKETMPTIQPGDLENRNLPELMQYIQGLAAAGMPLFPDETLQEYLREAANLPPADEGAVLQGQLDLAQIKAQQAMDTRQAAAGDGAPPDQGAKPFGKRRRVKRRR